MGDLNHVTTGVLEERLLAPHPVGALNYPPTQSQLCLRQNIHLLQIFPRSMANLGVALTCDQPKPSPRDVQTTELKTEKPLVYHIKRAIIWQINCKFVFPTWLHLSFYVDN